MTAILDGLAELVNLAVLAGSCIVKLPQLVQIANSKSVLGISEAATILEWVGYTATCLYNLLMRYPFRAWGEAAFTTVQCTAILIMYWMFDASVHKPSRLIQVMILVVMSCCLLASNASDSVISVIGLLPACLSIAARVPQIALNHQQGHTGQLAPATFALQLAGCLARLFTTIHVLLGDPVVLFGHGSSAILNLIILLQIFKHRRATLVLTSSSKEV